MFEDSMMESGGRIKTKSKYYTIVGVLLNGSILAALILVPLLYPEALPKAALTTMLVAPPPSNVVMGAAGSDTAGPAGLFGGTGSGPTVVVQKQTPKKVAISSGVAAGNLISKPEPTYPAIAKAARIQGTVVLSATISKTGTIEHLTVVSGPQMLAQSAIDAVKQWRYKPYLLNGEPVEVQTAVNVTFTLGG